MDGEKILVWLPSPMGDAILCTPALRAIREKFIGARIFFLGNRVVRDVLSPCSFNDEWIDSTGRGAIGLGVELKRYRFRCAILFKNSFSCGLGAFLSGAKRRVGYARDGRSFLLTDRIKPLRKAGEGLKPVPMIDYYLRIAEHLGCDVSDRRMELSVDEDDLQSVSGKLPSVLGGDGRVAILVPGGSFGPSKIWASVRYAEIARRLVDSYGAKVVVSVAPNELERNIAEDICKLSERELINLGEYGLSLGELKGLFADADVVVCNDTGPRHIAVALGRRVVSLFGPNDQRLTATGYADEIQIVGRGDCVPCNKPKCRMEEHVCMESISVDEVWAAVEKILREGA